MHKNVQLSSEYDTLHWINWKITLPDDFGPVTVNRHGHNSASLARSQWQFPKLRLFYADLVITVKPTTPEIFAPVGILVVDNQQGETSIFVVRRASGRSWHRRSQNRCTLVARKFRQLARRPFSVQVIVFLERTRISLPRYKATLGKMSVNEYRRD